MIYQLSWKILPGLRGLSCLEFHATPTGTPNNEQGVAVALASEAERGALLQQLEEVFGSQCFSNNAASFEAVKEFVLRQTGKK